MSEPFDLDKVRRNWALLARPARMGDRLAPAPEGPQLDALPLALDELRRVRALAEARFPRQVATWEPVLVRAEELLADPANLDASRPELIQHLDTLEDLFELFLALPHSASPRP